MTVVSEGLSYVWKNKAKLANVKQNEVMNDNTYIEGFLLNKQTNTLAPYMGISFLISHF